MQPDNFYELFSTYLMQTGQLSVKRGKGGLSYYKNGVSVRHFNARPRKDREDLGFDDFRYDSLRPYLNVESTIAAIQKDTRPEAQIKSHKLWCSLHFPMSELEHIAELFLRRILFRIHT